MALKLVPFNPAWITHDKVDVKAIYQRPAYTNDEFGEPERILDDHGMPAWDLTGPLPVKQHTAWEKKGFRYVTLADRNSLIMAYRTGTLLPQNAKIADYDQHSTGGPWNYRMYAKGKGQADSASAQKLTEQVHKFGSEAVLEMRREFDPTFTLPPSLQGIEPANEAPPKRKPGRPRKVQPAEASA